VSFGAGNDLLLRVAHSRSMRQLSPIVLLAALGCGGASPVASSAVAEPLPQSGGASGAAVSAEGPPAAEQRPVVHTYHGTRVSDPYAWLEGDDAEVRAFSDAQNAHARRQLDALQGRAALTARVRELLTASPDWYMPYWKGGQLLVLEDRPPKQQPYLVTMPAPDPTRARVLLDPNLLDASGGTSIDWFVPSDDGALVAVSLSQGGSESGTVHVYEVGSGKEHAQDSVPFVNGGTAGGDVAWKKDATGFWYTRYPHPGERPEQDLAFYQQVYFHRLGTDVATDSPSLVDGLPKIAEITLEASDDGRWLVASVADGDGGEFLHFLLDAHAPTPAWKRFAAQSDKVSLARFAADGSLWALSRKGAGRGSLLQLDPKQLLAGHGLDHARRVVPEGDASIRWFRPTATRVYVSDTAGGPSALRAFDAAGHSLGADVPLLPVSSLDAMVRLQGDDLLYRNQSFIEAPAWYLWRAAQRSSSRTALAQRASTSFDDTEVVRETCESKDGTRVPLSIVRRKGMALDGSNPTVLYGYGGYDIVLSPRFNPLIRLLLDRGGVYAEANLRGGGEFGEAWHTGGNLTRKQNAFDDFRACAHHLIDAGYTRPERLAIHGASNGGLLVGAALTQEPELFRAAVAEVGLFDMLRAEQSSNGVFNIPEFGSVSDEAQFRALYAYSPYHHVEPGRHYPATLFMTGENDPRVEPYQSRKMVARLQAAAPGTPVLLRTSGNTGHGFGSPLDAQIEQAADLWGFIFWQLGI
jgi:prolyl oligopeptidase